MGVERYVLDMFENVSLTIIEPVAYNPYKLQPSTWINQSEKRTKHSNFFLPKKILMKGPCDIRSIVSYLSFNCYFDYEFTYINNEGISIEQINHTDHIYQSSFIDDETKMELATLPFGDIKMYSNRIFSGTYDVICLSIITDANLGRYRRKKDGVIVAFGEHCYPLTDKSNWSGYVDGSIFSANCKFDVGFLESFAQEYEFIGRISVTDFIKNLKAIIELIPFSTEIVIISGVEKKYQDYTSPNYINRYLFHREMRIEIEKLISNYRNVKLINVNDFVFNQEDFAGHYNHFQPRVYHDIAFYLSSIIDCISPTIGMED